MSAKCFPHLKSSLIRSNSWQNFAVTVDHLETLTGYDFFSDVAVNIQAAVESRVGNAPPANVSISFTDVAPGEVCILSISSKRYRFDPQIVTANENLTNLIFSPQPPETSK